MSKQVSLSITATIIPDSGAASNSLKVTGISLAAFDVLEAQDNCITVAAGATETLTPNNTAGAGQSSYLIAARFAAGEPLATQTFSVAVDGGGAEVQNGYIAAGGCTTTVAITNSGANAAEFDLVFYRRI